MKKSPKTKIFDGLTYEKVTVKPLTRKQALTIANLYRRSGMHARTVTIGKKYEVYAR